MLSNKLQTRCYGGNTNELDGCKLYSKKDDGFRSVEWFEKK